MFWMKNSIFFDTQRSCWALSFFEGGVRWGFNSLFPPTRSYTPISFINFFTLLQWRIFSLPRELFNIFYSKILWSFAIIGFSGTFTAFNLFNNFLSERNFLFSFFASKRLRYWNTTKLIRKASKRFYEWTRSRLYEYV